MAHPNRVGAGGRKIVNTVLILGTGLLVSGMLFLTANTSLSAHPLNTSLPTLRPDYGGIYVGPAGSAAAWLDPAGPSLNPQLSLVNASVVRSLPSGKVVPDLATWSISKDHLVYTFSIRSNARFSNGHYVTAQDAAFSFRRLLTPSSYPATELVYYGLIRGATAYANGTAKTISGLKVLNARTLQITLIKPVAYFLEMLTATSFVFDQSVLGARPVGDPINQIPDNYLTNTCSANQGAGPFMFVCADRSSTLLSFYPGLTPKYTLVPNPYYYGHKPRVRLELISTGSQVDPGLNTKGNYKAYVAGKMDMTDVPIPYLNLWKGKSTQYHEFPSTQIIFFTPNVHLAPFDNLHCRLALAHAIDRNTLFNRVLHGQARPTYAVVPRGMLGYYSGTDNPHYDLSRARSEMARCPGRTTPVVLTVPSTFADRNAGHFTVQGLRTVGFNSKLKVVSDQDWGNLLSRPLAESRTQLVFNGLSAFYTDPQYYCTLLLRSGAQLNVGGWHNAAYDRLVDRAEVISDPGIRARLYIQAQHIALTQGAFISLSNNLGFRLIKPYVHGMIGTEVFPYLVPQNNDWSNVSVSPH